MAATIIFCLLFGGLIGYAWGNSHRGKMVIGTNELPNGLMRVISTDKKSTVLEDFSRKRQRFLISTEAFGNESVRPKDIVRKVKTNKEMKKVEKEYGINLGYPPLVKDAI